MAEGSITEQEYMDKLEHFVRLRTRQVEDSNIQPYLRQFFDAAAVNYKDSSEKTVRKQQADQCPQRDDHVPAESRLLRSSVYL